MLNLDDKEYDLNTLFSFEVLKEILLKLARNQVNLEEKVQNIINIYQNKETSEKDDSLQYFETDKNYNLTQKDFISTNELDKENQNNNKENNENKEKEKEITYKENTSQNNITKKKEVESETKEKKDKEKKEEKENELNKDEVNNMNNVGVEPELIKKMIKIINKNKAKISILEDDLKNMKKKLNSYETNNNNDKSDIEEINKKIKQISKKLSEHDDKIETIDDKCRDFDIITTFKDSGDGKIDATKVMVKSLEEKMLKKIEIVENKNKGGSYLNDKMELIFSKTEKDRTNIERLYNITGQNK